MDSRDRRLALIKGRFCAALVESVFCSAGYTISRVGREASVARLMKIGCDDFLPDFLAWRAVGRVLPLELHQFLAIEIKYRADLRQFLRREAPACLSMLKERWPRFYIVLVTDAPQAGRSCFQTICVRDYIAHAEVVTKDLHELGHLGIYRSTIEWHEALAQPLFATLNASAPRTQPLRRTRRSVHSVVRALNA